MSSTAQILLSTRPEARPVLELQESSLEIVLALAEEKDHVEQCLAPGRRLELDVIGKRIEQLVDVVWSPDEADDVPTLDPEFFWQGSA